MRLVKVEYPLKQGLKRILELSILSIYQSVKVEYPSKQGLKLRKCSKSFFAKNGYKIILDIFKSL